MPIFEYKCQGCGQEFSKLVFNLSEEIKCPECGATDVKKKISAFSSSSENSSSGSSCGAGSGFT
ncbi:regulatory protein, FmdB family [Flexistipes sinusarabici DSM 4947]|uniref:Regulatory protein, FmdB family n=2 Tax=Flexistipes sinusarabici TaxID=2352 RepID=F8E4Z1_FLESM|nr:zinc ribbon domain-containing protein [Flexistipes sinusarabici]AEI14561.1 regulatory protein, FmdB family [Flexistipes sinusarabici DSM 4947]HCW94101.1 zinc ribbon domain-containing protein [Flexistipes sinusarabici]